MPEAEVNRKVIRNLRVVAGALLASSVPAVCTIARSHRSTAAMLTLLAMFVVAAFGDWVLALATSASGILAFTWFFVDERGLKIDSAEGAATFGTMALTALTGTWLSLRAQRRTEEAEMRRGLFERMTQMGQRMAAGQSLSEVAKAAVSGLTELVGVKGARLQIPGEEGGEGGAFESGSMDGICYRIPLRAPRGAVLELLGPVPAEELLLPLGGMVSLHLGRSLALDERARNEAEKRSEALRSTVLNALAHDFRTPLTSIKVAASMLRSGSRAGEAVPAEIAQELIEVIDEEADRLDRLLQESLALARIDGKRRNPGEEECNIGEIAERVREKLARYAGRREFVVNVPLRLPRVKGDAFLYEQMLTQVTDNAWKYSEPGSRIEIAASYGEGKSAVAGDTLTLTVRNEGSQIPEAERELIFEKFYRGNNGRSKSEGTGLGLAIAKSIVETYGGRLRLEAEPLGPAFHFELPLANGEGRTLSLDSGVLPERAAASAGD